MLLFVIAWTTIMAQDYEPDFCEFKYLINLTCWKTDKTDQQVEYWENGNVRIEYDSITDISMLQKQYYESGNLKFTCEVIQESVIDTTYLMDPDTGELIISEICKGFKDVPHGVYQDFKDDRSGDIISTGNFYHGTMNGTWEKDDDILGHIKGSFNDNGLLEGAFTVFYYTGPKIKLQGQYSVIQKEYPSVDPDTGERIKIFRSESERDGQWVRYDYSGDTLQTIDYTWKKK